MKARTLFGAGALLAFAMAINLAVWLQDPFSWSILTAVIASGIMGLIWLVLLAWSAAGRSAPEGRALGGFNAALSSLLFLGICIMVYVFVQRWDASWDLTEEGRRDLAPQTVKVLQSMTQKVQVMCFFPNIDDELVFIARDKTLRFLDECRKYSDLIEVELLDPDIDKIRLDALNLTHISSQGTVVIRSGERQRVVMLNGGSPRLEERDFTNALVNVLREKEPVVYMLQGHNEQDISDQSLEGGSLFVTLLQEESYDVKPLQLSIVEPEMPADCEVLVIDNPKGDLHPREVEAVADYLERGGRLFLLLDPWSRVDLGISGREHFRPYLEEHYGIHIGDDIVLSEARVGDISYYTVELSAENEPYADVDEGFGDYRGAFHARHVLTRDIPEAMLFKVCRTVGKAKEVPEGVSVTELLRSPPDYYAESDVAGIRADGEVSCSGEERKGPLPLAVAAVAPVTSEVRAEGEPKDTRIVVCGDATFLSNGGMGEVSGNFNFALNAMAWLTEQEELVAIRPSAKSDPPLVLSPAEKRAVAWVSTLLTLQAVAALGLFVYLLRRKHQ